MHISEGVLSAPVLIAGAVGAVGGLGLGLRGLEGEKLVRVGVLSSAFFVASLLHFPLGPVSVHLVLNGLVGALLGWAAFPAIFVALLLQALLLQFGGITTLGVNTVVMALPGALCGLMARRLLRGQGLAFSVVAFGCGAVAILMSLILLYAALAFSGEGLQVFAGLFFWSHVGLMVIEGVVSLVVLGFLKRLRPEVFTD